MRKNNSPGFSWQVYDWLKEQQQRIKAMVGKTGPVGGTTDGQLEATGRPSEVNLARTGQTGQGGPYRFEINALGGAKTYCNRCDQPILTIRELFDHNCQV